jgi:hypothetical protein
MTTAATRIAAMPMAIGSMGAISHAFFAGGRLDRPMPVPMPHTATAAHSQVSRRLYQGFAMPGVYLA